MGISKIMKVKGRNGKAIGDMYEPITFEDDDIIGIDALILIYESLCSGPPLATAAGKITMHIITITRKLMALKNKQVWVFDNKKKMKEKADTLRVRLAAKRELLVPISEAVEDIKELLTAANITWMVAPPQVEAEAYLVELRKLYVIDYVLSRDSDVLAYGNDMVTLIDKQYKILRLKCVLKNLDIDQETFREMCCHLGNDFNAKTVGLSHLTVLDKMMKSPFTAQQHGSFVIFSMRYNIKYEDNVAKLRNISQPNIQGVIPLLESYECKKLVAQISNL